MICFERFYVGIIFFVSSDRFHILYHPFEAFVKLCQFADVVIA